MPLCSCKNTAKIKPHSFIMQELDTAIGKIKVCSGHQFLARLSRLFPFLLFIAFKSFVHRDFADFSVKRQTDDGIYHDTDEKHLREQRRLYVECEPAGKLLHHKLVDYLQQLVIHRQTDEQAQYDRHGRGCVVQPRDLPIGIAQDLDDGNRRELRSSTTLDST